MFSSYSVFWETVGSHKETLKNCNFVLKKYCSHVRIVPPTFNMVYMYLEENVSQAFRKAVMFTNYVKLKDNPSDKWKNFMIYTCNFSVRFSFYITYLSLRFKSA